MSHILSDDDINILPEIEKQFEQYWNPILPSTSTSIKPKPFSINTYNPIVPSTSTYNPQPVSSNKDMPIDIQ